MCVIFVAVDAHRDYRIVIAANRDEYYDRPTASASFWPEAPHVLAGRDLRAGGTWLGVTRTGRLAAVTSYRSPGSEKPEAPSRGKLVADFLLGADHPFSYLEKLSVRADRYSGFNLLVGEGADVHYYSNHAKGIRALESGIHGLSNHVLDTPWPKIEKGKKAFRTILTGKSIKPGDIFHFLLDRTAAPDESLPDTGVGWEKERMLSPLFISSPDYGTRSSTVILLDRSGRLTFIEKAFEPGAQDFDTVTYTFTLEGRCAR